MKQTSRRAEGSVHMQVLSEISLGLGWPGGTLRTCHVVVERALQCGTFSLATFVSTVLVLMSILAFFTEVNNLFPRIRN